MSIVSPVVLASNAFLRRFNNTRDNNLKSVWIVTDAELLSSLTSFPLAMF